MLSRKLRSCKESPVSHCKREPRESDRIELMFDESADTRGETGGENRYSGVVQKREFSELCPGDERGEGSVIGTRLVSCCTLPGGEIGSGAAMRLRERCRGGRSDGIGRMCSGALLTTLGTGTAVGRISRLGVSTLGDGAEAVGLLREVKAFSLQ